VEKFTQMQILRRLVTGHDFSHADSADQTTWASQAAEKLDPAQALDRFVTGHDFSRADKADKTTWASAPAEPQSNESNQQRTISQTVKPVPFNLSHTRRTIIVASAYKSFLPPTR
jgi:hypothetical protein